MLEKYLWVAGAVPFIVLGTIHLLYTFFTNRFSSRTIALDEQMKNAHPVLTKETTMWKAWIGFNGSHSLGAIYFGVINLFFPLYDFGIVQSPFFLLLNISSVSFYVWLAKRYWFSTPFKGIMVSAGCFIAAALLILFR